MEVNTMSNRDQQVVTEATWRPGLPPPIEALQERFPPEDGYTVEYGTWLERNGREPGGWRRVPVAIVTAADGRETTFLPTVPSARAGAPQPKA